MGDFIGELPCERLIRNICGPQWRALTKPEIDAAWGIAIVHSMLKGKTDIAEISRYLGVSTDDIIDAYRRLNLNGIFKIGYLESDRQMLESEDVLAWSYYGGYACGATQK